MYAFASVWCKSSVLSIMKVKVAGKINLDLYITGTRDKLHTLDSIMTSVSVYDRVSVKRSRHTVVYENGAVADMSCPAYRAINAFEQKYGPVKVTVKIKKGIPFSSGMGGSSADSAAVLFCLGALYGRTVDPKLALQAGSDTPFMLYGGTLAVGGVGEELRRLPHKRFKMLLVKHGQSLNAKDVYAKFDALNAPVKTRQAPYSTTNFYEYLKSAHNDLYDAVAPATTIDEVKALVESTNPIKVQLTGSGPALFAVYASGKDLRQAKKYLDTMGLELVKIIHTKRQGITLL